MPTYAYVCDKCHHEFDAFQSITAKPLRECPACGKKALRRLIGTGAGIIFKGSGFYCTDYRSDGYKKTASSDAGGTIMWTDRNRGASLSRPGRASSPTRNSSTTIGMSRTPSVG